MMSDLSDSFMAKLPLQRRSAVHTAYAHAPDYITSVLNQYSNQLNYLRDTEYEKDENGHFILNMYGMRKKEPCHYSPGGRYIAMHNDMTDAEYSDVIQHELGHFIDDVLGRPSTDIVFKQAFSDLVAKYNTNTFQGKMLLRDMLDDAFSTGAAFDRNVTDIISAVTENHPIVIKRFKDEDVAYYRHDNSYWNRLLEDRANAGMKEKDTFANVFAITTGNYRISTNFVERWFPELPEALRESIRGE